MKKSFLIKALIFILVILQYCQACFCSTSSSVSEFKKNQEQEKEALVEQQSNILFRYLNSIESKTDEAFECYIDCLKDTLNESSLARARAFKLTLEIILASDAKVLYSCLLKLKPGNNFEKSWELFIENRIVSNVFKQFPKLRSLFLLYTLMFQKNLKPTFSQKLINSEVAYAKEVLLITDSNLKLFQSMFEQDKIILAQAGLSLTTEQNEFLTKESSERLRDLPKSLQDYESILEKPNKVVAKPIKTACEKTIIFFTALLGIQSSLDFSGSQGKTNNNPVLLNNTSRFPNVSTCPNSETSYLPVNLSGPKITVNHLLQNDIKLFSSGQRPVQTNNSFLARDLEEQSLFVEPSKALILANHSAIISVENEGRSCSYFILKTENPGHVFVVGQDRSLAIFDKVTGVIDSLFPGTDKHRAALQYIAQSRQLLQLGFSVNDLLNYLENLSNQTALERIIVKDNGTIVHNSGGLGHHSKLLTDTIRDGEPEDNSDSLFISGLAALPGLIALLKANSATTTIDEVSAKPVAEISKISEKTNSDDDFKFGQDINNCYTSPTTPEAGTEVTLESPTKILVKPPVIKSFPSIKSVIATGTVAAMVLVGAVYYGRAKLQKLIKGRLKTPLV